MSESVFKTTSSGLWTSSSASSQSFGGGEFHQSTAISHSGAMNSSAPSIGVQQLSISGTSSFIRIHKEVAAANVYKEATIEVPTGPMRVGRPGGGAVGELTPIGDVVVPLLLCAMAYAAIVAKRMRHENIK